MSGFDAVGERRRKRNPYGPMAVASTSVVEDPTIPDVTVVTDAIRQADRLLDEYLDGEPESRPTGTVMSLRGDYGTGKTHLGMRLVRRARAARGPAGEQTMAVYLDATATDFLSLFKGFMDRVTKEVLVSQVREYYADIVAAALQETGLSNEALQALAARRVQPQQVIRDLGLLESALLRKVQDTLTRVTENTDYSTVLSLLLRSGFQDAVWEWVNGGAPSQILRDRGITTVIDGELSALEALRVFALLFSGRRNRFVLVIDELDKIFSVRRPPDDTLMAGFQNLLQVSARSGACLVLCGLPEVWKVVSPAVLARIPSRVELTGLSTDEIEDFMRRAHRSLLGEDRLEPFTPVTARMVATLTRGNARDVIRLCGRAFRLAESAAVAAGADVLVDERMLNEAAAEVFGAPTPDDVEGQIWRLVESSGWEQERRHLLGASPDSAVEFWITFADRVGGCAVLLTRSLLTDADIDHVLTRIDAVRTAEPAAEVLVIVAGVPTPSAQIRIRDLLGRDPVVVRPESLTPDVAAALESVRARLQRQNGDGAVAGLRRHMDLLADRLEAAQREVAERVRLGIEDLAARQRAQASQSGPAEAAAAAEPLPTRLVELFDEADTALGDLVSVDAGLRRAFTGGGNPAGDRLVAVLEDQRVLGAAGAGAVLRQVLRVFRDLLADWFRAHAEHVDSTAHNRLDGLCDLYDDMAELLPAFTPLDRLRREDLQAGSPLARAERVLENFSFRVREMVLDSVATG